MTMATLTWPPLGQNDMDVVIEPTEETQLSFAPWSTIECANPTGTTSPATDADS